MKRPGLLQKFMAAAVVAVGLALPMAAHAQGGPRGEAIEYGPRIPDVPYYFWKGHPLAPQSMEPVDVRLALAFDSSDSMKPDEHAIQFEIAVKVLQSDEVLDAWFGPERDSGAIDSIAISVIEFGGFPQLRVPWVDFRRGDPHLKERLALFCAEMMKIVTNRDMNKKRDTRIGDMLDYTKKVYINAPWDSEVRDTLDVFGDGASNGGMYPPGPRKELARMGVTVNALAIVNEQPQLDFVFKKELVTQAGDSTEFILPGRVWAVARNMKETGNGKEVLTAFEKEVTDAFRRKIVWETVQIELPPERDYAEIPPPSMPINYSLR